MDNYYLENNNRGEQKSSPKKKFDFKSCQKNTFNSLKDVEYFLNHFQCYYKYFKLYKLLKK